MVGLGIALVAVLVVVGGAVVWGAAALGRRASRRETAVERHDDGRTLRYPVPPGGDVAVLVAALDRAGYVATLDPTGGVVSIAVPDGRSRDQVRDVIARAFDGERRAAPRGEPVVFADER